MQKLLLLRNLQYYYNWSQVLVSKIIRIHFEWKLYKKIIYVKKCLFQNSLEYYYILSQEFSPKKLIFARNSWDRSQEFSLKSWFSHKTPGTGPRSFPQKADFCTKLLGLIWSQEFFFLRGPRSFPWTS